MVSTLIPSDSDTLSTSSINTVVSRNSASRTAPSVLEPLSSQTLRKASTVTLFSASSCSGDVSSSCDDAPRKNSSFWLSYAAVCICTFVSALDIVSFPGPDVVLVPYAVLLSETSIPTSLPSIIESLSGGTASSWVGSSYTLASAALVPFAGNLANIFGRRPIMLGSIVLFALGSSLSGGAQSMEWLIIARVVQGMGGGGMTGLSSIIVADLVPLAERGAYQGFKTMIAFAFLFVLFFLQVHTPSGDVWKKLILVDWLGNCLLIAGTISSNISLTWAGVRYAWTDVHVLAPLIGGIALTIAFVIYEKHVPAVPTMHWEVVTNRTALASPDCHIFQWHNQYIHHMYGRPFFRCSPIDDFRSDFLPLFFQAVFLASPLESAIYSLPSALPISPFSFLTGIFVLKAKRYLPGNYVGWALIVVGFGILSRLGAGLSLVVSQIIVAAGTGIIISSLPFALMAPIPVERIGSALAFQAFLRTLSQTWGITISAAILQNTVKHRFPVEFIKELPSGSGSDFAFASISRIAALPEPLQQEVKVAFGQGISAIYRAMIGVAGVGFLCVLFMKEVPMRGNVDPRFGLKNKESNTRDVEAG
ncbi:putative transporter C3H1.06c [Mycena sanguinolenta]|uniref:Putative transporter C3H1.06c n=1 Tax=Mycena sanguinolenta TaxID=230812 RepID=A0A8H6X358_9AGAR|nr:putative transporter C3H1.06c [Mycena sanguinolenta]